MATSDIYNNLDDETADAEDLDRETISTVGGSVSSVVVTLTGDGWVLLGKAVEP